MDTSSHNESIKGSFMKSIDIKSLLIGILGTALVMVLTGMTHSKGKYQLECSPFGCFLLNTKNGLVKILLSPKAIEDEKTQHPSGEPANF